MKLYFAPMEGITDGVYRRVFHEYFGGADKYFAPFLSPSGDFRAAAVRSGRAVYRRAAAAGAGNRNARARF